LQTGGVGVTRAVGAEGDEQTWRERRPRAALRAPSSACRSLEIVP
jgi:hypothetical protein